MDFLDSYKHLEKLCGEILKDDRRISAYIDEMQKTPRASYYIPYWEEDLRNLKHYRWVRNKITHEPGCTEENMCSPEDVLWLDDFYDRIMSQTDPLSLYRKATCTRPKTRAVPMIPKNAPMLEPDDDDHSSFSFAIFAILLMLAIVGFVLIAILF